MKTEYSIAKENKTNENGQNVKYVQRYEYHEPVLRSTSMKEQTTDDQNKNKTK